MQKSTLTALRAGAASFALAVALTSAPALAQDTPAPAATAEDEEEDPEDKDDRAHAAKADDPFDAALGKNLPPSSRHSLISPFDGRLQRLALAQRDVARGEDDALALLAQNPVEIALDLRPRLSAREHQ